MGPNFREVIFNDEFLKIFDDTVRAVLLEASNEKNPSYTRPDKKEWAPDSTEDTLGCSYCRTTFPSVALQREHYKLDWHRYNLKQSLQSKLPVGEEEFAKKTENDDLSSISGSDSEDDEQDTLDTYATAQGKIFLQNKRGQVFSVYRGLLLDKKEELDNVNFHSRFLTNCFDTKKWTIFMLGGGHFAGAVFDRSTPVFHKTFHCYTVRAGQGGSQSSRDNKSGGSHPKSAGASLRRYNEQALIDHVKNVVTAWTDEIQKSSLIFYRASGPYNRAVLFGGKEPLLDRNDPRLRTIPFSTGRATFTEIKRVHSELSGATVYESLNEATNDFAKQKIPEKDSRRSKIRSSQINRAKSRELTERALPGTLSRGNSEDNIRRVDLTRLKSEVSDRSESEEEEAELNMESLQISFDGLEEFGDSLTPEQRKRGQNNHKKKTRKSKTKKLKEKDEARKKLLMDVLVKGNVIALKELFEDQLKTFEDDTHVSKSEVASEFFNEVLGDDGNTFLHVAAMNEHEELLEFLLQNEANPCAKNKNQQTPYSCTSSKVVRELFRKFAKENPDRFNYNKAQIPLITLTDEEIAEKKRAQRKIKRDKEKEKRKENLIKQKEQEEAERFKKLSDREKRALAAEKRILNAKGVVISRCFLCAADMAGKVPFEYLNNKFCSIDCLKSHRMKTTMNI